MRVVCLLSCALLAAAGPIHDNCTDGVIFNGQYYDKEILIENIETSGQFSIDKPNNILFYSYSEDNNIKAGYVNLETKEVGEIKEVKGGFATEFDDVNDIAYVGGEDGIYTFNTLTKSAQLYGARGVNIWSLFFWSKLYFADFPYNNIYDYNSGNPQIVHAFEGNFVKFAISDIDGIFFVNESGLYHTNKEFQVTDVYSTDNAYRFLFKDNTGNIYVGRKETENQLDVKIEIYKINKREKNIERVALINESISAMVFDKYNNIIYNEADKVVKLKLNLNRVVCVH